MPSGTNFALEYNTTEVTQGGSHSNPPTAQPQTPPSGGTVTSITTTSPLTGGPITTTGAIALNKVAGDLFLQPTVFNVADYIVGTTTLLGINAAIAALNAAGAGTLYFPAGVYNISGTVTTITAIVKIEGQGPGAVSALVQASTTENAFTITSANGCWIVGMNLIGGGSTHTGIGVILGTSATFNSSSIIDSCQIAGWGIGIDLYYGGSPLIVNSTISGNNYGIELGTYTTLLSGTPQIIGNTMNNTTASIHNVFSNGALIANNYIDSGKYAFLLDSPASMGPQTDMWFIGNHIEDYSIAGLQFNPPSVTGQYANIVIVGNEFDEKAGGSTKGAIACNTVSGVGVWLQRMVITGNAIVANSATGTGNISLYYAEFCTIAGNCFGLHTTNPGILIDNSCNNIEVCPTSNSFGFGTVFVTDNQTRTVATLQAAAAFTGKRTYVTNSNATLTAGIGAVVAGGGANIVPVFSDGTNWRIG